MNTQQILLTIWPLILIQVLFQIYALIDLFYKKKGRTRNLSALLWAIIIILGEIIGAAIYFVLGRSEE